ncbi:MAG: hypothetical protein KJ915_02205 [Candidatus Omnitrophica bacterium]|nr:hypothetical protein [Candidatus Omnitrophota bacterium]
MKKNNVMIVAGICACFILITSSMLKAADETLFMQVSDELAQQDDITPEEVQMAGPLINEMIQEGESKQAIKEAVSQSIAAAHEAGFKGIDVADEVTVKTEKYKKEKKEKKNKNK